MKRRMITASVLFLGLAVSTALAELTKKDVEDIRLIVREELQHIDKRIDGLDKRMDGLDRRMDRIEDKIGRLEDVMMWGFGLQFTSMFILVGFVLWDRRTAVAPVARVLREKEAEIEDLRKRERALEELLRDYSLGDQRLATLMKARGLL